MPFFLLESAEKHKLFPQKYARLIPQWLSVHPNNYKNSHVTETIVID